MQALERMLALGAERLGGCMMGKFWLVTRASIGTFH